MKIICSLFLFILMSCSNKDANKQINTFELIPNERITSILDSFLIEKPCKECLHEVFINKNPIFTEIVLYKGDVSMVGENAPVSLLYTFVNNTKFFIYSGVENYFDIPNLSENKSDIKSDKRNEINSLVWLIKDSSNIITIKKLPQPIEFQPE